MQSAILLSRFIILTLVAATTTLFSQNVGFNTTNPSSPLTIKEPQGVQLSSGTPVLDVTYTGGNFSNVIAIQGKSTSNLILGTGGRFEGSLSGGKFIGGSIGVDASASAINSGSVTGVFASASSSFANTTLTGVYGTASSPGDTKTNHGLQGYASGSQATNYGVHVTASGSMAVNYAVYGTAYDGSENWAGYFDMGDVFIQNALGIGNSEPVAAVDILKTQAVVQLTTSGAANGSVVDLRNTTGSPTYLGAINFSNSNSTPGQIGYLASNNLTIRVGGSERMRITSTGLTGLGRIPTTNRLEVEGNASKSSAGDWLANSDARLKKDIQPLNAQQTLQQLLALQGVTYTWNDSITGTQRPDGIQYGFTAQNISEVFPSLVEKDALGFLQTAYGTYDAMMVEAIRALYEEIIYLKSENHGLKQVNQKILAMLTDGEGQEIQASR